MSNCSSLSLEEIERRISIVRDNIRQLTEQPPPRLDGQIDVSRVVAMSSSRVTGLDLGVVAELDEAAAIHVQDGADLLEGREDRVGQGLHLQRGELRGQGGDHPLELQVVTGVLAERCCYELHGGLASSIHAARPE